MDFQSVSSNTGTPYIISIVLQPTMMWLCQPLIPIHNLPVHEILCIPYMVGLSLGIRFSDLRMKIQKCCGCQNGKTHRNFSSVLVCNSFRCSIFPAYRTTFRCCFVELLSQILPTFLQLGFHVLVTFPPLMLYIEIRKSCCLHFEFSSTLCPSYMH